MSNFPALRSKFRSERKPSLNLPTKVLFRPKKSTNWSQMTGCPRIGGDFWSEESSQMSNWIFTRAVGRKSREQMFRLACQTRVLIVVDMMTTLCKMGEIRVGWGRDRKIKSRLKVSEVLELVSNISKNRLILIMKLRICRPRKRENSSTKAKQQASWQPKSSTRFCTGQQIRNQSATTTVVSCHLILHTSTISK